MIADRDRARRQPSLAFHLALNVALAITLAGTVFYRFGAIQTLRISSINMAPTLEPDDRVVVRGYGGEPEIGDVVVYRSPFDPGHLQVGRVVGAGGNRVALTEEGLEIDGKTAAVPVPDDPDATCSTGKAEPGECSVPPAGSEDGVSLVGAEVLGGRRFFTRRATGIPGLLFKPVTVAPEHYFVLSDNRVDERDSRIYGTIPHHAIVGVLSFVYYASDETGIRWDRMTRRVS
jgi:signal peptidase I